MPRRSRDSAPPSGDRAPRVEASSRQQWRNWLLANHADSGPIWLIYPKKPPRGGIATDLTYDAIVEEALCFGWIDSLPRKLDDRRAMLYISPRKPRSVWSALNKQRVAALEAAGQLHPAGQRIIAAAINDGSWTFLDAAENLEMPPDLAQAMSANPQAQANYEAFPRSAKKLLITWIITAKRPQTRAARISRAVTLAQDNIRANAATKLTPP